MGPVPIGVIVLLSSGHCVAANATLEMLSRPVLESSIEGTSVQFGTAELSAAFARALLGEIATIETESPPILGAGQGLWRLHFLPFVVDEVRGAAVLFEDMTEHRLTAEAFRAAEQRFRLLVDSASDGIVIFRSQILLYANPEAVRLFGFESADELVGRPLHELVELEHRANFELLLGDAEAGSSAAVFETAFLRSNGTSFPVECRTSRARVDEMGAGYVFFRDITDRKRLQARRENARRVESLARLSTSVGHELQTYAAGLRSWLNRVKADPNRSFEALGELVELSAALSARAENFSLPQTTAESSASSTIEELLARVCSRLDEANRPREGDLGISEAGPSSPKSGELLVDLEPVPYPVRGEAGTIEAGLTTLALAALKARVGDVPLCIRGARLPSSDGGGRMAYRLTIAGGKFKYATSNHGNATFPPSAWTFGSWEQGQDLEVLGAFAMLQAQGCWVDVQNCSGGGHGFDVELCLDSGRALCAEFDAFAESAAARSGGPPFAEDGPPDTERSHSSGEHFAVERALSPVLICDDEARLVALTAGLLREFGFEVITVRSGAEAIRAVAEHPVDIVILDVNLPGEDAQDIVARLRAKSDVSIILSSGYTEEDIEPSLLQNDAVKAFLAKPYGVEMLVDTIDRVRQQGRGSASLGNGLGG